MIAQRFIVPPNPATPYTANPSVQGYVGVDVEGGIKQPAPREEPPPTADLYDVIVGADATPPATFYYHAEMQDDGSIVVKRDLFGKGTFKHTFAGWPIPGDPVEPAPVTEVPGITLPPAWLTAT
jgi:hypothetical protein